MLKVMMARKKLEALQREETELRSKQSGFKKREGDLAAQIEAASSEEEIAAAAAAVTELENAQKSAKDRLETIKAECDALLQEIADAESAAEAAAAGGGNGDGDERGRVYPVSQRRCREFQRTGRMVYENARSMVKRAAISTASDGVTGPTGVGGINDAAGNTVSDFLDLIKIVDATGMAAYKVAYMVEDAVAGARTEGAAPAESAPSFGYVELTPKLKGLITYISREIRKQSPLQYESKVNESTTRALRRILSKMAIDAALASNLNATLDLAGASGTALFTPHLLSDIILAYGGDEGVDGAAVLVLNKADLKAFAAVRGKNEYLPVYSITPDTANPSMGIIKDNNGLSCRYCLNQNVPALSSAALGGTATKTMIYGNPQCLEMPLWGGVEVTVNEGYKFGEGLLTVMGEVTADAGVTTKNGFVIVTGKTAE